MDNNGNKGSSVRVDRVASQIKKEISKIIFEELRDPNITEVIGSVTSVNVSNDLSHAKIYMSVLGTEKEKKHFIDRLYRASGTIRKQLGSKIKLRVTPELIFKIDESIDKSSRIIDIINSISSKQEEEKT